MLSSLVNADKDIKHVYMFVCFSYMCVYFIYTYVHQKISSC